jgi:hypothetical protein
LAGGGALPGNQRVVRRLGGPPGNTPGGDGAEDLGGGGEGAPPLGDPAAALRHRSAGPRGLAPLRLAHALRAGPCRGPAGLPGRWRREERRDAPRALRRPRAPGDGARLGGALRAPGGRCRGAGARALRASPGGPGPGARGRGLRALRPHASAPRLDLRQRGGARLGCADGGGRWRRGGAGHGRGGRGVPLRGAHLRLLGLHSHRGRQPLRGARLAHRPGRGTLPGRLRLLAGLPGGLLREAARRSRRPHGPHRPRRALRALRRLRGAVPDGRAGLRGWEPAAASSPR